MEQPPQVAPPPPSEQAAEAHEEPQPPLDQTSLIQNEEESFALAPVDASALKGNFMFYKRSLRYG